MVSLPPSLPPSLPGTPVEVNASLHLTLTRTPPLAPYTHLYALHALLDAGDRLSLHRIAAMLKGKRLADFFEIGPQGDAQSF
jgi:hypothetical protein